MAITPGDIRARFQMAMDRLYELEFSDKEAFDVYNNQHKIGPKTMVTIGGKKMKAGDVDKEETKKLSGTADRIDKIEKQLDSIEDIDQRENAEKLLEVLKKLNDSTVSSEDKKAAFGELVELGLVQKNASGSKIYVNTEKTGLFYKILGDKSSPKEITDAASNFGLDDIPKRSVNVIDKKAMTGAKIFNEDQKSIVKFKQVDNGVSIDGVEYTKQEVPSLEKMIEIYGNEKEAKRAILAIEKHNKIIEKTSQAFKDASEVAMLSAIPDTPPTTPENRKKLKDGTLDIVADGFAKQFDDRKPSKEQQQIIDDLKSLKNIEDPEEYDKELMKITGRIMADDYMKSAAADVVEMVSYVRELNKGNAVYMPAASNFPLGDIVSISPEKIDFTKDSPEEIRKKLQLIHVGVETRSIKKGDGGASASGDKTELSTFKDFEDIDSKEVYKDITSMSNKTGIYKEIFDEDADAAHDKVKELAKKYKFNLEDEKYVASRDKSVASAVAYIKKKNPDIDEEKITKQLKAYYDLGKTFEHVYNSTVTEQLFTNEVWTYDKKQGTAKADKTDGINSLAYLKFEFNIGFSGTGRPSNPVPTRFKNKDVEDDE